MSCPRGSEVTLTFASAVGSRLRSVGQNMNVSYKICHVIRWKIDPDWFLTAIFNLAPPSHVVEFQMAGAN